MTSPRDLRPVSSAQAGLWWVAQADPANPSNNTAHSWRLEGMLDAGRLAHAVDALVARHASLRTSFVSVSGEPMRLVHATSEARLQLFDLSTDPGLAHERLRAFVREPFDLEAGPLIRAGLWRIDATRHLFCLCIHHAVSDGGSRRRIQRELSQAYRGETPATPPEGPEVFDDYVRGERALLEGPERERLTLWWRTALASVEPAPAAPFAPYLPERVLPRGVFALDTAKLGLLHRRSRELRTTPTMLLLAAWRAVLARHACPGGAVIGVGCDMRDDLAADGSVGMYTNTLPVPVACDDDPTFADLVACARDAMIGALEHRRLPFETIVEVMRPARTPGRMPLVGSLFTYIREPAEALALDGIDARQLFVTAKASKADWVVAHIGRGASLDVSVSCRDGGGDAAAARRFAARYARLIDAVLADPFQRISDIPLVGDDERAALAAWTQGPARAAADVSIAARVRDAAARRPDAIAIDDGVRVLDYRSLANEACALAATLQAAGVVPGDRVAIHVARSVEHVIAMLAIASCGAAWVPLDLRDPPARRAALITQSRSRAVVLAAADERSTALPEGLADVAVVRYTAGHAKDAATPRWPDALDAVRGGDLACVLFTSGTTGIAKAVALPHRALARLAEPAGEIAIGEGDVVAHLSNPAFDAVNWEVWGALAAGATLHVIDEATAVVPERLARRFAQRGVTHAFITTAVFGWMAHEQPDAFAGMKALLFGGERADPLAVACVLRQAPPARLVHVYGPTETGTFATAWRVVDAPVETDAVPLGRPIAGTEVHVLDADRRPCAVGIEGEIAIGGAALALGYDGDAAATAAAFVAHPTDPAARLYLTGDRGLRRGDGALLFRGRRDRQLKLRGQRIEPEGIEAALRSLPGVRDATVDLRGPDEGEQALIAWVVRDRTDSPPDALRATLASMLPPQAVPARVVDIASMPLTSRGKLDRAALPAPPPLTVDPAAGLPRTTLEATIQSIWSDLLGRRPGVQERFFDAGGHSLLAARMLDRIEQTVGRSPPIALMYANPSIEELAREVLAGASTDPSPFMTIAPGGDRVPFVFLHGDFTGGGYYSRQLAVACGAERPFHVLHPNGLFGEPVPETIEAMAQDRAAALRARLPAGPVMLGGHCNGGIVALEIARILRDEGVDVPLVVMIDSSAPWQPRPINAFEGLALGTTRERPRRSRLRENLLQARPDEPIMHRYWRAIRHYRPHRYDGAIALLRSGGVRDPRSDQGWSLVSPQVSVHRLAGGHHEVLLERVEETGRALRACLDAADAGLRLDDPAATRLAG